MMQMFLLIGAGLAVIIALLLLVTTFSHHHQVMRRMLHQHAVSAAEQKVFWDELGIGCMYLCLGMYGLSTQLLAPTMIINSVQGILLIIAVLLGIRFVILRKNNE